MEIYDHPSNPNVLHIYNVFPRMPYKEFYHLINCKDFKHTNTRIHDNIVTAAHIEFSWINQSWIRLDDGMLCGVDGFSLEEDCKLALLCRFKHKDQVVHFLEDGTITTQTKGHSTQILKQLTIPGIKKVLSVGLAMKACFFILDTQNTIWTYAVRHDVLKKIENNHPPLITIVKKSLHVTPIILVVYFENGTYKYRKIDHMTQVICDETFDIDVKKYGPFNVKNARNTCQPRMCYAKN